MGSFQYRTHPMPGRCFLISPPRNRLLQPSSAFSPLPQDLEISTGYRALIPAFPSDRWPFTPTPQRIPFSLPLPDSLSREFHFLLSLNKGGGALAGTYREFLSGTQGISGDLGDQEVLVSALPLPQFSRLLGSVELHPSPFYSALPPFRGTQGPALRTCAQGAEKEPHEDDRAPARGGRAGAQPPPEKPPDQRRHLAGLGASGPRVPSQVPGG